MELALSISTFPVRQWAFIPSLLAETMVWLIFLRQHSRGPGGREEPSNNLIRDQRTYSVMEESSSLTCRIILLSWLISALSSPFTPLHPPFPVTLCVCVCVGLRVCEQAGNTPCSYVPSVCVRACVRACILHCIKERCIVSRELSDVQ